MYYPELRGRKKKYDYHLMAIGEERETPSRHVAHSFISNYNATRNRSEWIGITTRKDNGKIIVKRIY